MEAPPPTRGRQHSFPTETVNDATSSDADWSLQRLRVKAEAMKGRFARDALACQSPASNFGLPPPLPLRHLSLLQSTDERKEVPQSSPRRDAPPSRRLSKATTPRSTFATPLSARRCSMPSARHIWQGCATHPLVRTVQGKQREKACACTGYTRNSWARGGHT